MSYRSAGELVAERRHLDQDISLGMGSAGRHAAEARIAEIDRELGDRERRDERQAGVFELASLVREYLDARVEFASRGWSNTQLRGAVRDRCGLPWSKDDTKQHRPRLSKRVAGLSTTTPRVRRSEGRCDADEHRANRRA